MASIFSVQNLQTFLRRKNLRPPGPPPGPPAGRGERGAPAPGPECPEWLGRDAGACCSVDCVLVSSAMIIPSQVRYAFSRSRPASGSLNIRTSCSRVEAKYGDCDALRDAF